MLSGAGGRGRICAEGNLSGLQPGEFLAGGLAVGSQGGGDGGGCLLYNVTLIIQGLTIHLTDSLAWCLSSSFQVA